MVQRSRQKPAQPTWKWQEVPVLNETLCTGCGLCCALCPTDCLAMAGTVPWMPRPVACIGCAVCALVCPAAALAMTILGADDVGGGD
jgi:MinD superfamily P-loop ATPase